MPINRELSQFGSFVEVANSTKLGIVNPNVGIGTTNPTVKVEVHGDVKTVSGKVGVQTAASVDLQVYGQTQLDNINVLGIATFTGAIDANGGLNISGGSALVASSLKVSDLTDNRVVIAGGSGELEDDARLTFNGTNLTVGLGSGFTVSRDGDLTLTGVSTTSSAGPELKLFRNSASPADADYIGQIKFAGEGSDGEEKNYAKITGKILDSADGTEDGALEFAHIKAGSQVITGRWRSDSLQLLNSTNFSVNGNTTLDGSLDVDGHTDLDYVAVSAGATFASLVDVNGGLQANTAKIEDLTNNRVVLAGVGGELEDDGNFTFTGETVNIGAQLTVSGVSTFSSSVQAASFVTGASGAAIGVNTNTISGPAEMFIDPSAVGDNTGVLRIKGDLYVDGTTTQINSTTLEIADFVVGIASTATTDSLADGAGINIGPDNTFKYDHTNTSLKSSENLNVASGKTYKVNGTDVLSATTLGGAVVNSSLTSVGTLSALTVSGDVSIADKIIHTGDTNTALRFPENDTVTVETGGSERLRITSGGSVGIGTNSPNFSSFGSNTGGLEISDVNTNNALLVQSGANEFYFANTSSANYIWGDDNVPLSIATNDAERFRITSGGDVNVGNISNLVASGAGKLNILVDDTTNLGIATDGAINIACASGSGVGRVQSINWVPGFNVTLPTASIGYVCTDAGAYGKGDLFFATRGATTNTAATERLRITSAGKVGIGTGDPTGQVQIDTTSGGRALTVNAPTLGTYLTFETAHTAFADIGSEAGLIGSGSNTEMLTLNARGSRSLSFRTNSTERLRIDSSGRLLINKTTNRDQYYGGTYTGQLQVEGTNDATRLTQFIHNTNAASQPIVVLGKSRGTSVGSYTVVQNGDYLGTLSFQGADGDEMIEGARIDAIVSAAPGADDMPTALSFGVTADGASGTTERLKIHPTGWQESNAAYATAGINTFASWARTGGAIRGEIGYNAVTTDYMYMGTGTNHSFALRVNNDTALYIKNDAGRSVGIGTDNPLVQLDIRSTDAIKVPVGTTGERPTGAAGYIRYNSSIASYEGHNGSEWAGIGGAAEVETAVSSTSATTCESFTKTSYRSATIIAQITQGSSYQVGNYLLIHDGTTATLIEESAVATGDMLGTFTATISGSNVVFQVNMSSASSATVTTKMTKVSIP